MRVNFFVFRRFSLFVTVFVIFLIDWSGQDTITVPNVKLRFTEGTTMGIFVALAFPIDLPGRNVYYSHFFEAIHDLPSNETSFEYPPLIERNMDRQIIYRTFEKKIQSNGYPGKGCLLRAICEISQSSIKETNGLLGDIIHIIFTPSTTQNFGLSPEYSQAEKRGRDNDCSFYNKNCTISFVDLISWVDGSLTE